MNIFVFFDRVVRSVDFKSHGIARLHHNWDSNITPSIGANASVSDVDELPRFKIVAVSLSATKALEELDHELAQPDFLGDAGVIGTSLHREGGGNGGGVDAVFAKGEHGADLDGDHTGNHGDELAGMHRGEQAGESGWSTRAIPRSTCHIIQPMPSTSLGTK